LDHTAVTDNEREFSRIAELRIENWLRQLKHLISAWPALRQHRQHRPE
jgi:hypothetical protein